MPKPFIVHFVKRVKSIVVIKGANGGILTLKPQGPIDLAFSPLLNMMSLLLYAVRIVVMRNRVVCNAMHTFRVIRLTLLDTLLLPLYLVSVPGIIGLCSPAKAKDAIGPTISCPSELMEDRPPVDPVLRTHIGAVSSAGRGP